MCGRFAYVASNEELKSQFHHAEQLMSVLDQINQKYGRSIIRLAAEGYSKPWALRAELKSPAYTTRWSDVPQVSLY